MYSESNNETNSYRYLKFAIQPTCKKKQISGSLRLPLECSKSEGFWAVFSWAEPRATYMSTVAKIFFLLNLYTKNKEES